MHATEAIEFLVKAEKDGSAITAEAYNYVLRTYFRSTYLDKLHAQHQRELAAEGVEEAAEPDSEAPLAVTAADFETYVQPTNDDFNSQISSMKRNCWSEAVV